MLHTVALTLSRFFSIRGWLCATFVLCLCPLAAQAADGRVIQVPAERLENLLGHKASSFSFFTMQGNKLAPIAHQFIDFTTDGVPWFKADKQSNIAGKPGIVDAADRFLFRLQDTGPRIRGIAGQHVVGEIAVEHNNRAGFVYIVKNAYLQSTKNYVKFDPDTMQIKTTNYSLDIDPNNLFVWNDFFWRGATNTASSQPVTLLDTLKLRVNASLFGTRAQVKLNNNNLSPDIEEITHGPLSTNLFVTTTVKVAKVPFMKIRNYFMVMPQQVEIHSRMTIPAIAKTVLEKPSMSVSLDGHNLQGGRLITSWLDGLEAVTDGRISEEEKQMLAKPLLQGHNWFWFNSGSNFDVLAQLDFREGFSLPIRLVFEDDYNALNPPERFPGQQPNVGFAIDDIPIGEDFYFIARIDFHNEQMRFSREVAEELSAPPLIHYTAAR